MDTLPPKSGSKDISKVSDIRLLVLDIDGTIAGDSNQVSPKLKQVVRAIQAKGIRVAIATGRMYCSALRFHREIGSTLPLLAYQGALIQDPVTQTCYRHWPVAHHIALELLDYFEQPALKETVLVHVYIGDRLYVREITAATIAYAQRSEIQPHAVSDLRQILTTNPTKVLAMSRDYTATLAAQGALIAQLHKNLRERYSPAELYLTQSSGQFLEAAKPGADKGTAVSYLTEEILNLKPHNTMVIGDNFNDLEMIAYAGIGIAMGNAPAAVKAIADWIAPDIEADGAAAAIAELLL